jgi:hypothetical protein
MSKRQEGVRARLWYAKRNARVRGISWRLSDRDALALFDKPCHLCGSVGTGLDRVESSKGYTKANTAPCCWPCNRSRGRDMTPLEFVLHCEAVMRKFYGDEPPCDVDLIDAPAMQENTEFDWYEVI